MQFSKCCRCNFFFACAVFFVVSGVEPMFCLVIAGMRHYHIQQRVPLGWVHVAESDFQRRLQKLPNSSLHSPLEVIHHWRVSDVRSPEASSEIPFWSKVIPFCFRAYQGDFFSSYCASNACFAAPSRVSDTCSGYPKSSKCCFLQ